MKFHEIRLQNFRNIGFTSLDLCAESVFFVGRNGQGKTNLLEALGLITALRSFRVGERKNLVCHGKSRAEVFYKIEGKDESVTDVYVRLGSQQVDVEMRGEIVKRLSDILGLFPTVVLSSDDMQILRGRPSLRRRFIDLTLCSIDAEYFEAIRHYQRALMERNAALKTFSRETFLDPYDKILAQRGSVIYKKRQEELRRINDLIDGYYAKISGEDEKPELIYKPDVVLEDPEKYLLQLKKEFDRDRIMKSTTRGVHRDDCLFKLKGKVARDFGSEGQQRSLVLALRLAQMEYFREKSGMQAVVLADDILGELDPDRSKRFWSSIDPSVQVIATGTVLPSVGIGREWKVYEVDEGAFELKKQETVGLSA